MINYVNFEKSYQFTLKMNKGQIFFMGLIDEYSKKAIVIHAFSVTKPTQQQIGVYIDNKIGLNNNENDPQIKTIQFVGTS